MTGGGDLPAVGCRRVGLAIGNGSDTAAETVAVSQVSRGGFAIICGG
jgi:hypothetical protein